MFGHRFKPGQSSLSHVASSYSGRWSAFVNWTGEVSLLRESEAHGDRLAWAFTSFLHECLYILLKSLDNWLLFQLLCLGRKDRIYISEQKQLKEQAFRSKVFFFFFKNEKFI